MNLRGRLRVQPKDHPMFNTDFGFLTDKVDFAKLRKATTTNSTCVNVYISAFKPSYYVLQTLIGTPQQDILIERRFPLFYPCSPSYKKAIG